MYKTDNKKTALSVSYGYTHADVYSRPSPRSIDVGSCLRRLPERAKGPSQLSIAWAADEQLVMPPYSIATAKRTLRDFDILWGPGIVLPHGDECSGKKL
jgi:hypothetical protein